MAKKKSSKKKNEVVQASDQISEIKDNEEVVREAQTAEGRAAEEPTVENSDVKEVGIAVTDTNGVQVEELPKEKIDDVIQEPVKAEEPKPETIESEKWKVETSGPTPEPMPSLPASAPKKRLTLQERLALAAKSGKSSKRSASENKTKGRTSTTPEPTSKSGTPSLEVAGSVSPFASPATSSAPSPKTSLDISRSVETPNQVESLFPDGVKYLPHEDLLKLISEAQIKYISLASKNISLKEEKQSLQAKLKNVSTSRSLSIQPLSYNEQIIKEKDERISQLLKEGEALSVKELKYNNTIKKLIATNSQNETEVDNLQKRVNTLETERRELKDSLKLSQTAEKEATILAKTFQIQLNNEKEALEEEIAKNKELSTKVGELSKTIIEDKNQYTKEVNQLNRALEKEKQKSTLTKEDHAKEISRLEERVEHLRFQAENAQTKSTSDESFVKLTRQYETLQKQYTSATENWQSIEATLQRKINDFEDERHNLRQSLKDQDSKIQILSKDLESKITCIDELNSKLKTLSDEHSKLQIRFESVVKSLEEAELSLDDKELKFKQEKNQLEFKIETLEKQVKEAIQPQTLNAPDQLYQPPSQLTTPSMLYSRQSSITSAKFREVGFGESSETPNRSRKNSAFFQNSSNHSFDDDDSLSEFNDHDTVASPVQSRFENHSSSVVGGSSVQLLGKLSGQVRRLETEMSLLREELDKANEDKKEANAEIVRLMKENEQVDNFKTQIRQLEKDVEIYTGKYERTLEILGEKSEQVEELKADVVDLKDLMKLQVQQMIELQQSK